MKEIRVELEDGRLFAVDAGKVAHSRAKDIADHEEGAVYVDAYQDVLEDDSGMLDWMMNNMDWYETDPKLIRHAVLLPLKDAPLKDYRVVVVQELSQAIQ